MAPSYCLNNLSSCALSLAYIHRTGVFLLSATALNGAADSKLEELSFPAGMDDRILSQCAWLNFSSHSRPLLAVSTHTEVLLYTTGSQRLTSEAPFWRAQLSKLDSKILGGRSAASHFLRGLGAISNVVLVGTSWGCVLGWTVGNSSAPSPTKPPSIILEGVGSSSITCIASNAR